MITFKEYLIEKKDHLIDKLNNLSPSQKDEIKKFFILKPNLENKIDWRKKDLTYNDFVTVMYTTKTERENKVKRHGIQGLVEGSDYFNVNVPDYFPFEAYIPLNWEASKLIASNRIGDCVGDWCISYQKGPEFWYSHTVIDKEVFIFLVGQHKKVAVSVNQKNEIVEIINKENDFVEELWPELNISIQSLIDIINNNRVNIHKAREILLEHWFEKGIRRGEIIIKNAKYEIINGLLVWWGGDWIKGTWWDGKWVRGNWKGSKWCGGFDAKGNRHISSDPPSHWSRSDWYEEGIEKGTIETKNANYKWEFANKIYNHTSQKDVGKTEIKFHWLDGTWLEGTFLNGVWENGVWENGVFEGAIWRNGIWKNGTFRGKLWIDGEWYNGRFSRRSHWNIGINQHGKELIIPPYMW